jgi:flagellum-specific ATP synthase
MMELAGLTQEIRALPSGLMLGRVSKVVGLIVESTGPEGSVGEQMIIHLGDGRQIMAEVVGFHDHQVMLMPVENTDGIRPGLLVEATGHQPELPVSDQLLGRVIDPLGRALDDGPDMLIRDRVPIHGRPPNPMQRRRIGEVLATGVRSIDGLLTLGKGQRIGIFSGSGVGKSTLLGMIARNTTAQVNVIALVGERGRDNDLGPEGLARSVVVVATSDQTPLLRLRCALSGTAVAEYFMRQGKDVLLMMDSVTRFAMAQREVGLSAGEPPSSRGYTPSVFALLPRLMERAGTFEGLGSITGIYTVLVEGADILPSISRLFSTLAIPEQKQLSAKLRDLLATYQDAEDLIQIGAYTKGSSANIDQAIQFQPAILAFLRQAVAEGSKYHETLLAMGKIFGIDLTPFLTPAV